jgi:hypothetical protein
MGALSRGIAAAAGGLALIFAAPAAADTHTANFDTLPGGAAVAADTAISTQYPGVVFPDSPAPQAKALNSATHSPPNALKSALTCSHASVTSCPAHVLPMNFSPLVSQVRLYAGDVAESELGGTWGRLVGYSGPNGTGSVVAQSYNPTANSPSFPLHSQVNTLISMTSYSGTADIASAVLYVGRDTAGQGDESDPQPATIDDLVYVDNVSPSPPTPAAPTVTITAPADNSTFQAPEFASVSGLTSVPAGIDGFCIVVDQTAAMPADCQNVAFAVGADGHFSNVTASGLTSGAHTITAWVRDTRGRFASSTVHVTIATPSSGVDLRVNGMEVTQGSQNLTLPNGSPGPSDAPGFGSPLTATYTGVGLAQHGVTVARVYANAASLGSLSGPARHVATELYGFRETSGGMVSLGAPIRPLNGPVDMTTGPAVVGTAQRIDPAALTFQLPESWTEGTIRLVAVLNPDRAGTIAEANRTNNVFGLKEITFTPTRDTYITAIQFTHGAYTDSAGNAVPARTTGPRPADAFSASIATTPLGAGQLHVIGYAGSAIDVTAILRCNAADQRANRCSSRSGTSAGANFNRDLLNKVNDWRTSNDHAGKVFALGYNIGGVTSSSRQYAAADLGLTVSGIRPLSAINHELGHMFLLDHSSRLCGGGTGGQVSDPSYPDPEYGRLNGFAFDRRTFRAFGGTGTAQDPLTPASLSTNAMGNPVEANGRLPFTDLETYCYVTLDDPAVWLSPFNWTKELNGLKVGGTLSGFGAGPARNRAVPRAAGGLLRVSASAPSTGAAEIIRVEHPENAQRTPADPSSAFHVVLRDADGEVVGDLPVTVDIVHSDSPPSVTTYLDAVLPAAGAARVEIVRDGEVIASRDRSAHAPAVRLTSPKPGARIPRTGKTTIRWRASDADGDPLQALVQYSPDNGHTWHTLSLGVAATRLAVGNRLFSAARRGRVRVVVNDGFADTTARSGAFRAAGARPSVQITSPSAGTTVASTASLVLSGQAYDDALRPITGKRLTWFDGKRRLGRGATISVRGLPAGTRRLQLRAKDRNGRTGRATVTVKVRS